MTEIKPCPFCGSPASPARQFPWDTWGYVMCQSCEARGPEARVIDGWEERAIEFWNERTEK